MLSTYYVIHTIKECNIFIIYMFIYALENDQKTALIAQPLGNGIVGGRLIFSTSHISLLKFCNHTFKITHFKVHLYISGFLSKELKCHHEQK